jgi:hypothetical protein
MTITEKIVIWKNDTSERALDCESVHNQWHVAYSDKSTKTFFADSKKRCTFAAVSGQGTIYNISKGDFLCPLDCLYLQRYKAVSNLMIPASYVKLRFLGRKSGGEAAFSF